MVENFIRKFQIKYKILVCRWFSVNYLLSCVYFFFFFKSFLSRLLFFLSLTTNKRNIVIQLRNKSKNVRIQTNKLQFIFILLFVWLYFFFFFGYLRLLLFSLLCQDLKFWSYLDSSVGKILNISYISIGDVIFFKVIFSSYLDLISLLQKCLIKLFMGRTFFQKTKTYQVQVYCLLTLIKRVQFGLKLNIIFLK